MSRTHTLILSRGQKSSDWYPSYPGSFHWLSGDETERNAEIDILHQAGNSAVIRNAWHLTCTGQDGNPMDMTGQTVAVLRRQSDGNWLVLVDNPYGFD